MPATLHKIRQVARRHEAGIPTTVSVCIPSFLSFASFHRGSAVGLITLRRANLCSWKSLLQRPGQLTYLCPKTLQTAPPPSQPTNPESLPPVGHLRIDERRWRKSALDSSGSAEIYSHQHSSLRLKSKRAFALSHRCPYGLSAGISHSDRLRQRRTAMKSCIFVWCIAPEKCTWTISMAIAVYGRTRRGRSSTLNTFCASAAV
jgi:hypothetical protein